MPAQLRYRADNAYVAAQKFLTANELPMSHVEQVVKFIEANTAGAQLGSSESSSGAADPFTGK
jgi:phospholipase A-2-activating protein